MKEQVLVVTGDPRHTARIAELMGRGSVQVIGVDEYPALHHHRDPTPREALKAILATTPPDNFKDLSTGGGWKFGQTIHQRNDALAAAKAKRARRGRRDSLNEAGK